MLLLCNNCPSFLGSWHQAIHNTKISQQTSILKIETSWGFQLLLKKFPLSVLYPETLPDSDTETVEKQKHHRVAVTDKTHCEYSDI